MWIVEVGATQMISQDGITGMQDPPEVGPDVVGRVVDAEIRRPTNGGFGQHEAALGMAGDGLDVHDDEVDQVMYVGQGPKRRAPIDGRRDVGRLQGVWIQNVQRRPNAIAQDQGGDVTSCPGKLDRKGHEVIFADRDDFHRESELVRFRGAMDIHGDQLLRFLAANGNDGAEEVDKLLRVIPLSVEEIQSILDLLDVERISMSGVFEDQLFEVEEGSFVRDFLSNLNDRPPGICGV